MRWLLRLVAPAAHFEELALELDEERAGLVSKLGDRRAREWYRRQVIGSIPSLVAWRLRSIGAERLARVVAPGLAAGVLVTVLMLVNDVARALVPLRDGLAPTDGWLGFVLFSGISAFGGLVAAIRVAPVAALAFALVTTQAGLSLCTAESPLAFRLLFAALLVLAAAPAVRRAGALP